MGVDELTDRSLFTGDGAAHAATFETLTGTDRPVARFDRPRAATRTRVAVVSDPHVSTGARGTWKLYHRTRERFREAVAALGEYGVDAVAVSGDLTKDGEGADLDWTRAALDGLDLPVLPVPGNHDVKTEGIAGFERRFADGGYPVHRRVGDVDLVGVNTAMVADDGDDPRTGTVSAAQLDRLDETLADLADPVVVAHHNLPGLNDRIGGDWEPHSPVGNADALVETLARHDVPLHVSGHVHLLSLVGHGDVHGLIAPPLSSFPQAFLLLDIGPAGTTVRAVTAASGAAVEEAYDEAQSHSVRSRVVSALNAEQFGALPLVDERTDPAATVDPILSRPVDASSD